jgi:hypothetical protein
MCIHIYFSSFLLVAWRPPLLFLVTMVYLFMYILRQLLRIHGWYLYHSVKKKKKKNLKKKAVEGGTEARAGTGRHATGVSSALVPLGTGTSTFSAQIIYCTMPYRTNNRQRDGTCTLRSRNTDVTIFIVCFLTVNQPVPVRVVASEQYVYCH